MNNNSETDKKLKGFTLVELIVVIAIIGILSAILVPSIMGYIEKARNTADISNAKQITNALQIAIAISPDTMITHGLVTKIKTMDMFMLMIMKSVFQI